MLIFLRIPENFLVSEEHEIEQDPEQFKHPDVLKSLFLSKFPKNVEADSLVFLRIEAVFDDIFEYLKG